jgi:YlmC/YmxH family sporulation protein
MRLSDLGGKEIIGLDNGERIGVVGDADLEINPATGEITSIILPGGNLFRFGKRREEIVIPWDAIVKVGPDMMIIQMNKESVRVQQE